MKTLLKTHFGYDTFRPLQNEIITTILAGNDTLVLMPTGGGKSLCYQLPALMLPGITLVISPLIALMKDQVDALCANGISAAFLNSSLTAKAQRDVLARAESGELKILYLAPERLSSGAFEDVLKTLNVSLLAIDEAHCISEWGHDFCPDYRALSDLRKKLPTVPVIALTATATLQVRQDIVSQLKMDQAQTFVSSFNRANLHYAVTPKYRSQHQLVELLQQHKGESAIVYCFSRKDTENVARSLSDEGFPALPYHAGLQRDLRRETQERFIRDEVPIIVATIAFGMGIDKPDVRLVVHMDLPKTVESYYQETGRAGRDGLPASCVLFYSYADRRKQEYFIEQIEDDTERALALSKLDQAVAYGQINTCRRAYLLSYFGEDYTIPLCGACDNCVSSPVERVDATTISQKILSAVLHTGERFGAAHICDVLRGSRKKRLVELRHDHLSVHGCALDISMDRLRDCVRALEKDGYLEQNDGDYPTLRVGKKGKRALVERLPILLPLTSTITSKKRGSESALDYDEGLFAELRALRKIIADQQDVPPFVIFPDKTLHEMATYYPSTKSALSTLFGIGEKKLEAFGDVFLEKIIQYSQDHHVQEKSRPSRATRRPSSTQGSATLDATRELLELKHSVAEIAKERGLSAGTIIQHTEKLLQASSPPDISHLQPEAAHLKCIQEAFDATGGTMLAPVHTRLQEKYSYDELRLARLFL